LGSFSDSAPAHSLERRRTGTTEAMQREVDELTDDVLELAEIVSEGLERTQALVADLRDFASPENKERVRTFLDIEKCVRSALNLMRPSLAQSTIEVSFEVSGDARSVEADSASIGQVLLNLLKNAADVVPKPGGRIDVRLDYTPTTARIQIADNGPGIAKGVENRLFEPFFTTKPPGEGSGLGLAISRRIIADHSGRLDFSSEPGEGTRFWIELPLAN